MITTRRAESRDADAAARLARDAYRHYVDRIGREPAPMTADYAAAVDAATLWVAEDAGRIVGIAVLVDEGDHLLLENVAVDPASQGRGIGGVLLALADDEARRLGHDRITLYTNVAMTENIAYYPRRGYVETHRAEQDGRHRVFFTRTLDSGPPPAL
ncbi:GNAT family N-acetyltransferase [Pseudonocardia endophytica]|uniref:N-acetylglutamate synthase-like GNAT family acetyltransferase n=1 Tax=Pseudonocardia endophytica TaxID=401976 RepID=A0A4R1HIL8_PSEEN|nr:GNAT family N-acetyltransferase [Pseudonocardia endophytica]TCK20160.1 N-acetylglutamate synthase-like GNAT family acetyltransferase [Pseudonocardia endophytica]